MNLNQIQLLFAYDAWANELIFDALAELPESELHEDIGFSYRTLFGTLLHIVGAEDIWLSRWKGEPKAKLMEAAEAPTLEALRKRWHQIRDERDALVSSLGDERLNEELNITTSQGQSFRHTYWQMFQHLANHSSYHRGQIAVRLRQTGRRPPATDLIRFYRER